MEQKQTAVEWLIKKLQNRQNGIFDGLPHLSLDEIYNQAKEMEKQQKMECWEAAHQAGRFEGKGIAEENWQTFEQYYNEEYGK